MKLIIKLYVPLKSISSIVHIRASVSLLKVAKPKRMQFTY